MSLHIPVSVRLTTSRAVRHITADVRDLTFRSTAPGGFASATVSLHRPLAIQPDEIAYYGGLTISDARNGMTLWDGRLEDPGRSASADGQVWELAAVGGAAHARDRRIPLIYIDRSLDRWVESQYGTKLAIKRRDENAATGATSLVIAASQGTSISVDWEGDWINRSAMDCGQKLSMCWAQWSAGRSDSNFWVRIYQRVDAGGSPGNIASQNWSTSGGTIYSTLGDANFSSGQNVVSLRAGRDTTATTASDDGYWAEFHSPVVMMILYNADGSEKTTGYLTSNYTSTQIVNDLLGRLLPGYDGALGASVNDNGILVDHMAYPDGVTAAEVLDDLMQLDPASYWAAWERNTQGKFHFEWKKWPSTVRYIADVTDGIDAPGSAEGLWNAVTVRYREPGGLMRRVRQTATVQTLADAGLTREELVDLGDEIGSAANAAQVAATFLAEHANPPNAGRLTIARPILDTQAGRMVQPWEIRPGNLIRVRGIVPRADALNPSSRDGLTVYRVVATEYRASDASAVLELDSYAPSTARLLADLANQRNRRR